MARHTVRKWGGRTAFVLGSGALSASLAQADIPNSAAADGGVSWTTIRGEATLELHEGRIFLIEPGRQAEELFFNDNSKTDRLRQLVEEAGRSGPVRISPLVVADGAGGVQWVRPKQSDPGSAPANTRKASAPEQGTPNAAMPVPDQKKGR